MSAVSRGVLVTVGVIALAVFLLRDALLAETELPPAPVPVVLTESECPAGSGEPTQPAFRGDSIPRVLPVPHKVTDEPSDTADGHRIECRRQGRRDRSGADDDGPKRENTTDDERAPAETSGPPAPESTVPEPGITTPETEGSTGDTGDSGGTEEDTGQGEGPESGSGTGKDRDPDGGKEEDKSGASSGGSKDADGGEDRAD